MRTIPGNLTSPRAGPILCPDAPLLVLIPEVHPTPIRATSMRPEPMDGLIEVAYRYGGAGCWEEVPADNVSLDLTADLGPTIALRWLGRHYGIDVGVGCPEWSRFGGTSPVWCLHTAKIDLWFASGGRSAVDRCATNIFDVPGISAITSPLQAIVAACLHAAQSIGAANGH